MQNPSFETVVVSQSGPTNTSAVLDSATTQVPHWTRTSASLGIPLVLENGAFGLTAVHHSRMAALDSAGSSLASQVLGLVGEVSAPTSVGQTYAVSVAISVRALYGTSDLRPYQPALFELRLRESATGTESAPVLQTSIDQETSWVVLTGTVTANAVHDGVVLRFYSPDAGLNARTGLIDDVRLCQAPGAPSKPTLPAGSALAAGAKQTIPPANGPMCATNAVNLVLNPGFESVSGAPHFSGDWPVYEALLGASSGSATTQVTDWTRTDDQRLWPRVAHSGTPFAPTQLPFQGARYALVPATGYLGGHFQGLVGTLSSTTSAGATYVVSAQISTDDAVNAPTFELRLRNNGTGAESDAAAGLTSITLTSHWTLITATVPANAAYDRLVLRYRAYNVAGSGWGFVDDVRVCEAAIVAGAADASGPPIIAILIGLLVMTLLGGAGLALRTSFIGGAGGGVWRVIRSPLRTSGVTARSSGGSVGDPHETTGDGFRIAESESPRPMDREAVTDDLKRSGSSSGGGGTVNDPGSSL